MDEFIDDSSSSGSGSGSRSSSSSIYAPASRRAGRPEQPAKGPDGLVKPHIFLVLEDDLGHDDVAFNGNAVNLDVTGNFTAAARAGIILKRHYVHWHCSPTRRSLLTGRLPLHHSEYLSSVASDDVDLRWTTIGEKMQAAGYRTYWYGKGHTGYKSQKQLPTHLGFDAFTGFLGGAESHFAAARWQGDCPFYNLSYSADLYGSKALETLRAYDPHGGASPPLFFYMPWQNVHAPYQAPLDWKGDVLRGMLHASDKWFGRITDMLKAKGMWDNTVIFFSADNGGTDLGSNWPLRGGKHSNWEGGMRVAAFVSGGLVPAQLRGTESHLVMHVADWYTTACALANPGAGPDYEMCRDDPPVPPQPVDPNDPCIESPMTVPCKDIYGAKSFPKPDGVNVWPLLTSSEASVRANITAAHEQLWLSAEVLLRGDMKLLVAQQQPAKTNNPPDFGWKCGGTGHPRCDTRNSSAEEWVLPTPAQCACGCDFKDRSHYTPCLFDVGADPSEFKDLGGAQKDLLEDMWRTLNLTNLELWGRAPGPRQEGSTPAELLGPCNSTCADQHWTKFRPGSKGPICNVPGCS